MKILGIAAYYHDAAAALLQGNTIVAAAQEERFTRIKHDPSFPANAIQYCLDYAGCTLDNIDMIAFYDKPFLKFERLLETYYAFAPKGWLSFLRSMPVWMKEKIFLKKIIRDELKKINGGKKCRAKILFPEHHLSHAASAFYPSPFDTAAILTIDGVGEWATTSICRGNHNDITVLKELHFPHSVGLLYAAFTYFCGFKVNSGEYKLMGLAPYGNKAAVPPYIKKITTKLVDLKEDGSIWLNQQYFTYATADRMVNDQQWEQLFGFKRREPDTDISQQYCDLALAIQMVIEDIVIKMATEAKRITGADNLCLAGGVALNCVANGKLSETYLFKNIFIQPAAGDAGGALGAAYAACFIYARQERKTNDSDALQGSYLGPAFGKEDIEKIIRKYNAIASFLPDEELMNQAASLLQNGNIVGWFQGRMEFGPRALGNRSILADARREDMQRKLNLSIKFREGFRPFAPAVLAEDAAIYFELKEDSPYMLLVKPVKESIRIPLSTNDTGSMREKLYHKRSSLPAITHVDYSARVQTVHANTNPAFHALLTAFKQLTGIPVLVNTSFNVRGEPIVHTPEEAFTCFMKTGMDYLILGNYLFDKQQQQPWPQQYHMEEMAGLD